MTEEMIAVASGSGADPAERVLPLTWAQANMWDACWGYGPDVRRLNVRRAFPLPWPVPQAELTALLADLGARYDILRTTFDHDTRQQVIHRRVEVPVTLAGADELAAEGLAGLAPEASAAAFDLAVGPPWRAVLVVEDGDVRAVVLVLSHLAFDGIGTRLLRQLVLDAVAGEPGGAPAQAADLVRDEASGELQARSDRALRRWRAALTPLPPGCGIRLPAPGSYSVTALESAAVAVAAQTVAVRTGVSTGVVIAAALSRALVRCLPLPPSLLLMITSNRHHPDLAAYVGLALQNAYFVIPPEAPGGFDDYVRRCFTAAMAGFRSARYDNARFRAETFAAHAGGAVPDLSFFFNDVRGDRRDWDGLEELVGTLGSPDEPGPAVVQRWSMQDSTFFFTLAPAGRRCSMTVMADDRLIGPAVVADVLNCLRDLLVTAATSGPPVSPPGRPCRSA